MSATLPQSTEQLRSRRAAQFHLVLTAVLLLAVLAVGGLAATGRVRFGPATPVEAPGATVPEETLEKPTTSKEGRYQIETIEDCQRVLDRAGKLGFLGQYVHEAWAFKYTGGYLQCQLENEFAGEPNSAGPLPDDWKRLLSQDDSLKEDRVASYQKQGYIVLAAMRPTVSISQGLAPYHVHLGALLAGAHLGPMHILVPLHLEARHHRPYRLFLSSGPMPKTTGVGFNLVDEQMLLVRGPLVPRSPSVEDYRLNTGKDFTPGRDVTLLDRQRGYNRIRLKVRFLGDGEVRGLSLGK